jgi:hypothetical protein
MDESSRRIALTASERSARVVIAKAMLEFQSRLAPAVVEVIPVPSPPTATQPPLPATTDSFSVKMLLEMEGQQRMFLDSEELQQRNHIVQYVTHVFTSIIWGAANRSLIAPAHVDPVPPVHPAARRHHRSHSQPPASPQQQANLFPPYGLGVMKGLFTIMTNPMACCRRFQVTPPDSPRESIEALPSPRDGPPSTPSVPPPSEVAVAASPYKPSSPTAPGAA